MPEGRGAQVEGNCHSVGLNVADIAEIYVHEAENGVGELTFFIGQQLDAVECTVEDTVAVDSEKFHSRLLFIGYSFQSPVIAGTDVK